MAKPIKLNTEQQAAVYDLWWRLRDATAQRDWRELDKLRCELRELFDLDDKGLAAGREIYQARLSEAKRTEPAPPENFRDLPKAERRRLIYKAYEEFKAGTSEPEQPAPRPDSVTDRAAYDAWFESLTIAQRDAELDRLMDELTGKAQPAPQPEQPVDENELVDAGELAQLRAMWGDDDEVTNG